jgi:transcription elongation factor GreB
VGYGAPAFTMSKAFTTEDTDPEDPEDDNAGALPEGVKNYMTPRGHALLVEELRKLRREDRPPVVELVSWAAGNGDRSENGDYLYGKKRLREIDRRIRYLMKRLGDAEVVDPKRQQNLNRVFFGATVTFERDGQEHTVTLTGPDEADAEQGRISWLSPLARALLKSAPGDTVVLRVEGKAEEIEVLEVKYTPST